MKKTISLLLAVLLALSTFIVSISAATPEQPVYPGYNYYCHYPVYIRMAGLPGYIKARFDYDRDFIDIVPDYPGYGDKGFLFPLAGEEYGSMYDVRYTVDDTVITYEYTLKDGYTLDDYLDRLDAKLAKDGSEPESREDGETHSFPIFDIAMKQKEVVIAKTVDLQLLDVVSDDGAVLYRDGESSDPSKVYCQILPITLSDPDLDPVPIEDSTEADDHKYKEKLLEQYSLSDSQLIEYEEIYEHTDDSGEVDWALVKAATEIAVSPLYISPRYFEFGNRVMDVENGGDPFSFDMGVYSVKHGCFFDVSAPELYELDGLERVWTDIGAGRLIGDMDGDDHLDIADAALILRCQAGMIDYPDDDKNIPIDYVSDPIGYFSDFDQDGERSVTDATDIQRYLAELNYRPSGWTPYPHVVHPTEPIPTESAPTESVPTESAPTESVPTESAPTDPVPTELSPTEAVPTEPAPTEPAPTEPESNIPLITGFRSIGKGVEIHLSTVKGAEKYRVYYKNRNGNWVKMGETSTKIFIDDDVAVGTEYRYTVRCIKADLSEFTSDFDHTGWAYTYKPELDTPKITDMEAVKSGVKLTWSPVDGADLYRVYYMGPDGSAGWQRLADVRDTSYTCAVSEYGLNHYTVRCLSCKGKDFASDYQWSPGFNYEEAPRITGLIPRADCMEIHVKRYGSQNGSLRIYRKTDSGWKRLGELPYDYEADTSDDGYVFYDYEAEVGETCIYTARSRSDDGNYFTSWYNSDGWTKKYSVENYVPELGFAIWSGDNMMLVQAKENKFGLSRYLMRITDPYSDMGAEVYIDDEPHYIRADEIGEGSSFRIFLNGVDSSGKRISAEDRDGSVIVMIGAPEELKVRKTGDRKYRFTWIHGGYSEGSDLNLISSDGEYAIDSGFLRTGSYEVDLSDYPEDVEWTCIVWSCTEDEISCSLPVTLVFREQDYQ